MEKIWYMIDELYVCTYCVFVFVRGTAERKLLEKLT